MTVLSVIFQTYLTIPTIHQGKGKKRPVEDVESENMQEDDEMFNVQNEAMGGGNEQEDLTQEEKDSVHQKRVLPMKTQRTLSIKQGPVQSERWTQPQP